MKEIIERTIPEDVNLFETIVNYMQQYECWIYISDNLYKRLAREYNYYEYALNEGRIYIIRDGKKELNLYVDYEHCWNRIRGVTGYLKENSEREDAPYTAINPAKIIFLS